MTNKHNSENNALPTEREVREKLVSRGAMEMDDLELLSIVIQDVGSGRDETIQQASRVLEEVNGSLVDLMMMDLRKLRMVGSLGMSRAARLSAALELGRRLSAEQGKMPTTIASNDDVVNIFRPKIAHLGHEEFWVLYLSSANGVLDSAKVSQGGVLGALVDRKIVVKRALELLASSIVLVHNHPSGVAKPSNEDRELTQKVIDAASLFDIAVLDHLIITSGECFSFRKEGLIE